VVIASKTGGMSELLEDGQTGFLFENGNTWELAEKIKNLEKYNLNQIGQNAREKIMDLNINNHLEKILSMYKKYVK